MLVPVSDLVVTKDNPRLTPASKASHDALVASLSAHGLIQPIVVRRMTNGASDKFEVIAGTRRLAAIQQLGWPEVEVVENDAEYGVGELGTAENMMREAMHPLDECAAITRLVAAGESDEDVGGRFGQTRHWVQQRMKLNALAPKIADAFREGRLGLSAAQAYTVVDRAAQEKHFGDGKKVHQTDARMIAQAFASGSLRAELALFPLELYPQTQIRRDLFSEDVWLDDRKAFDKLQIAEIKRLAADYTAKGWGEVVTLLDGPDYKVSGQFVKTEGRVLKDDRPKHAVLITYSPGSGRVTVDEAMARRKDAKVRQGKTPAEDVAEEVVAKTADEIGNSQSMILGALQTQAIEVAIVNGDLHTILLTLLGPLLGGTEKPEWAAGRSHILSYDTINDMLEEKLEAGDDPDAVYKLPSRATLEKATLADLTKLLGNCALRSMQRVMRYSPAVGRQLDAAEIDWMCFDPGFLKRYRSDQLIDLAERLRIDVEGLSKTDMVATIHKGVRGMELGKVLKLGEAKAGAPAA